MVAGGRWVVVVMAVVMISRTGRRGREAAGEGQGSDGCKDQRLGDGDGFEGHVMLLVGKCG